MEMEYYSLPYIRGLIIIHYYKIWRMFNINLWPETFCMSFIYLVIVFAL